jgi:phospholipase/carboxylesterase
MPTVETVEVEPAGNADGSVIWLHGLGADGHDFEPIVPELDLEGSANLRFVFPHAPVRPVTINGGAEMRAWFDILALDRDGQLDDAGIEESRQILLELIQREHERGIAYERIAVAGFSQGGAIAMLAGIGHAQSLAGLMALSTYLPLLGDMEEAVLQSRDLPVFMAHGSFDPVLPLAMGANARDWLMAAGFDIDWREYPMAHAVCPDEIADIRRWLMSVFANTD